MYRPWQVVAAGAAALAPALALGVLGAVELARSGTAAAPSTIATDVFFILAALVMTWVASRLLAGRTWARSVIITWCLLLALSLIALARLLPAPALVGLLFAVGALVLLATAPARAYLGRGEP